LLAVLPVVLAMLAAAIAGQSGSPPSSSEKSTRTAAQRKIDSQILYEVYRLRGEAARKGVPPGPTGVRIDDRRRALVDIRAEVSPALDRKLVKLGASVVERSPKYRSILAWVPLLELERLASDSTVTAIHPAPEATTGK
jgi:hypothetical protein